MSDDLLLYGLLSAALALQVMIIVRQRRIIKMQKTLDATHKRIMQQSRDIHAEHVDIADLVRQSCPVTVGGVAVVHAREKQEREYHQKGEQ